LGLVRARKLSQAPMRNIRENLFLSFVCNVAGIPLAAGVFSCVLQVASLARGGGCGDGALLGQCHCECAAAADGQSGLMNTAPPTWTGTTLSTAAHV
jgi:cation transport ATPase